MGLVLVVVVLLLLFSGGGGEPTTTVRAPDGAVRITWAAVLVWFC